MSGKDEPRFGNCRGHLELSMAEFGLDDRDAAAPAIALDI
jgi:hypothetical protein